MPRRPRLQYHERNPACPVDLQRRRQPALDPPLSAPRPLTRRPDLREGLAGIAPSWIAAPLTGGCDRGVQRSTISAGAWRVLPSPAEAGRSGLRVIVDRNPRVKGSGAHNVLVAAVMRDTPAATPAPRPARGIIECRNTPY